MRNNIYYSNNRATIASFKINNQSRCTINNVKAYGKQWGKILCFLGFASKITHKAEKVYVNSNSLFERMFFTWVDTKTSDCCIKNRLLQNNKRFPLSLSRMNSTSRKTKGCLTIENLQTIFNAFNESKLLHKVF